MKNIYTDTHIDTDIDIDDADKTLMPEFPLEILLEDLLPRRSTQGRGIKISPLKQMQQRSLGHIS